MNLSLSAISREWRFMLRHGYILAILIGATLVSCFAVVSGLSEVAQQTSSIEHLKLADQADRQEAQSKHDDVGALAYYSFHLTYSKPSELAFAALGERDVQPWKHRIRMLALEGQIYETDSLNPELAQAGMIDFTFVVSVLSPLLIILMFHDVYASERTSGRYNLLVSTSVSWLHLWGARISVRFFSLFLGVLLPFIIASLMSGVSVLNTVFFSCVTLLYMIFWLGLTLWFAKKNSSAPRIASVLIGIWLCVSFIVPIAGDIAIKQTVHSPTGADILLTQREAVNDAWDLPKQTTFEAFVKTHPQFRQGAQMDTTWDWKWYYAFQQVGDQVAEPLSLEYRAAVTKKYQLAAWVAMISPPMIVQRLFTQQAQTDVMSAFEYEQQIREFHTELRMFYYPFLFGVNEFDKSQLANLPTFEQYTQHKGK